MAPSARASQILRWLALEPDPLPVSQLAERLRVSRRTVFRELEWADQSLAGYGLSLTSATGRGLTLVGPEAARSRLLEDLERTSPDPPDRHERLPRLALLLIESGPGPVKLSWYASQLGVSEATLSVDLARLEKAVDPVGWRVIRRQGRGVYSEGGEQAARRAMVWAWGELAGLGQPVGEVAPIWTQPMAQMTSWMTAESVTALRSYLAAVIVRLRQGHNADPAPANPGQLDLARRLADCLVDQVPDPWPPVETDALSVMLAACRPNQPLEAAPDYDRQRLVFRLIEAFDPRLAPLLKLDRDLVEGLSAHLESALVRLDQGIDLGGSLTEQLAVRYPDVVDQATRAADRLAGGRPVPDSEVGFLAAHFGAALHRLEERGAWRRRPQVAVVCLHGIGSSYLLAAQLRQAFGARARFEVSSLESGWDDLDLVVSTVPLPDCPVPVVETPPVLDRAAAQRVKLALAASTQSPRRSRSDPVGSTDLVQLCSRLGRLSADIVALTTGFVSLDVAADSSLERLARLVGYRFGGEAESGKFIFNDLMERERVASQVVPELGLVLLHCRTAGVEAPVFALLSPVGGSFRRGALRSVRAGVVMLVPAADRPGRTELMGHLSGALVEAEGFLDDILRHRHDRVLARLQGLLRQFLIRDFENSLKG
ncbi:MAG: HTH domain-containing protein [Propionibacteriaceae bacterium]|jgi:mannitol operon transcriptional antiterminator|nr:HTH domain-containing protein [Propionibacteriaceae bacterium]